MRKVLTISVSVVVTLVIVGGVIWYFHTQPERKYDAQTDVLRRVVERQELELKAYQYGQAIAKIKAQPKPPPEKEVVVSDPNK
jgi:hypothetical protein